MKKILIIVVLFCLSTMTFKTEAELKKIPDKDFQEFFTNFQSWLVSSDGNVIGNCINYQRLEKNCKSNKTSIGDICWNLNMIFLKVKSYYSEITRLSPQNNYKLLISDNNNKVNGERVWTLDYLSDKNTLKKYDSRSVYKLSCSCSYYEYDSDCSTSEMSIIFAKPKQDSYSRYEIVFFNYDGCDFDY